MGEISRSEAIDILRFAYPKEVNKPITEMVISKAISDMEKLEKIEKIVEKYKDTDMRGYGFAKIIQILRGEENE